MDDQEPQLTVQVNADLLYQTHDGREAWLIFSPAGHVTIVTDIHQQGPPANAVPFDAAYLRRIADIIDARQAGEQH